jgi:membrane-associated phospholipid phosphatase
MSPIWLDSGIEIVLFFQGLGAWLSLPMQFFSFLGSEQFFLLIAPAIYWCINSQIGLRLGIFLSLSAGLNTIFKLLFHSPRPYWYDPRVVALVGETSFGLPSGHSQNAVVVWGSLAASVGMRWLWYLAVVLILLTGFSRIFLGVHFPTDVLFGWLIGFIFLLFLLKIEPRVLSWLKRNDLRTQIGAAFVVSVVMILFAWLARQALGDWNIPLEWIENATKAFPNGEPIDPLSLSGIVSNGAIFFGLAAGGIWVNSQGGFRTEGTVGRLVLRYLIGLIGVLLFWYGLGAIFPDGEEVVHLLLRYFRYTLVGFWVSALAPLLFIRLKLADPVKR